MSSTLNEGPRAFPWGLATGLFVVVLVIFGRTIFHDFVNYDDDLYVTANARVQEGLTWENAVWAFTNVEVSNWHPLTWLSHMADVEVFGSNPAGHHLVSVLFHAINSVVLLVVLYGATGARWRSALVAALFALHPLHVESVAWIAERKDVLSTFFWLAALGAYTRYAKSPSMGWYGIVSSLILCALMAKPMAVTAPFTLLLWDLWPLQRIDTSAGNDRIRRIGQLVLEKSPWIVLAVGVSVATLIGQRSTEALAGLQQFTLGERVSNALAAYILYLVKMIVPVGLAPYYPHEGVSSIWLVGLSCLVLIGGSVLAVAWIRRRPYVFTGWFWYLGTLVPVIGLVQVGDQAMADRYTYVPLIGIFVVLAWGLGELAMGRELARRAAVPTAVVALLVLTTLTWNQLGHWRDSVTLFEHTLAVTESNSKAHNNLGTALFQRGEYEEAARHFEQAVELAPGNIEARNNLGAALLIDSRPAEAERVFRDLLARTPDDEVATLNLAVALIEQGRRVEALRLARKALEINPRYEKAAAFLQHYGG